VEFQSPDPALEQYQTSPEIAATLVHTAGLQGDVSDHTVVDLGCGTGMLALAAALCGPARVVGVEIDGSALETAQRNEREVSPALDVTWVRGDVTTVPLCRQQSHYSGTPITVVMNPPFGAQAGNEHADRAFLETARDLAAVSYSIHNAGSADFVTSFAGDADGTVTHAFAAELPLPRRFDFQELESKQLDVEIFRIEWSGE
jgi:putative methylase